MNIGNVFFRMMNYDKSLENYLQSYDILKEAKDTLRMGVCLGNIGNVYIIKKNYAKALEYYNQSIDIRNKLGDFDGVAACYANLAIVQLDQHHYKEAIDYVNRSLEICEKTGNKLTKAVMLTDLADIYSEMKDYKKSIQSQMASLQLAKEMGSLEMMKANYEGLSVSYNESKNYNKALEYYELFLDAKDSMLNEETMKSMAEMQTKYETEKKDGEIKLLQTDKTLQDIDMKKQEAKIEGANTALYSFSGLGLLLLLTLVVVIRNFIQKRKINDQLSQLNFAITDQKNKIEFQNSNITRNIEHAKSFQKKMIPSAEMVKKIIPNSFVLFKPKDIVSGDFYWLKNSGDKTFLAAVDCTGHGVPGAFMSIHGYNLLEKITNEKQINSASEILDELNDEIRGSLSHGGDADTEKFGMDMSAITIDRKKMELQFAGARNPVIIIRADRSLVEIKADRVTIGSASEKFTNHTLLLQNGDMIYLFSDGYADQIGGPQRKKYLTVNFKNLLLSIAGKNVEEQQNILAETHHEWMGNYTQTDDVMVIGIRV